MCVKFIYDQSDGETLGVLVAMSIMHFKYVYSLIMTIQWELNELNITY